MSEQTWSYIVYAIAASCIFAWFFHIFTCFEEGFWGFLIAGAMFFPIGILHGFYLIAQALT